MNWAKFKVSVCHGCLSGAVVAFWSLTQEVAGPALLMTNIFCHWILWKHLRKNPLSQDWTASLPTLDPPKIFNPHLKVWKIIHISFMIFGIIISQYVLCKVLFTKSPHCAQRTASCTKPFENDVCFNVFMCDVQCVHVWCPRPQKDEKRNLWINVV